MRKRSILLITFIAGSLLVVIGAMLKLNHFLPINANAFMLTGMILEFASVCMAIYYFMGKSKV